MPGTQHVAGGAEVDAVRPVLQLRDPPGGDHVVEKAGIQRLELVGAPRHQDVHVAVLRHRATVGRFGGQGVSFVDGHPVVVVGEDAGSAESCDAGPDDDGMVMLRGGLAHDLLLTRSNSV